MEALIRRESLDSRGKGCLLLAVAFLFFVLSSTPHRVHHFFEQTTAGQAEHVSALDGANSAHEADHGHRGLPKAPGTESPDCAVLSLAQNAHASTAALVALPVLPVVYAHAGDLAVLSTGSFNPSPFSQRAPPLA
jgi:hypothetical protein